MAKVLTNYSHAEKQARAEILASLKLALGKNFSSKLLSIEYPPEGKFGDYSVGCFILAQKLQQPAVQLARQIAETIKPAGLIKQITAVGPYLNFFVDKTEFNRLTLQQIIKNKNAFGSSKLGAGSRVMVEYFGPNTNKPLTIGHLRNLCLGFSLCELLKFLGYKVIPVTIYNDRGIALAKTILAYQKWGNNQTPKDVNLKPDHFVGQWYVKFGQEVKTTPELDAEAQKVLRQWEAGEKEVKNIWQNLTEWALQGYKQTLDQLGIPDFEEKYYESEYYQFGKEVVEHGLAKGIFKKHPDGYVYVELTPYGLPDKILLRSDGTSLYLTQDLYLAQLKSKQQLTKSIVVSGSEQDVHFKQVFKILELLGISSPGINYHLSYGMMRLASGRIKSREGLAQGTVADNLIAELEQLASQEIKTREPAISSQNLTTRSRQIALAALKFYILAVDAKATMIFEPKKSIAFVGKTGPYLQYVYARINSILAKVKIKPRAKIDFSVITQVEEFDLVKILARFPSVVLAAATSYNPADLAQYLYNLAKAFSLFYEKLPVLQADDKIKEARLVLIHCVKTVLVTGLSLLGIEAPEKM